ncbi:hypothetical protein CIPAW_08G087900 [Carya illinoinensis]|uniref:Uncharacterized protein n=1 Tax=Carya illinoinensis TaxID=32201 RepID=A0A8T1PPN8_CARIL|nr:hypothetical protein CIPAW_08G087900 [Carya illinoinensis]
MDGKIIMAPHSEINAKHSLILQTVPALELLEGGF